MDRTMRKRYVAARSTEALRVQFEQTAIRDRDLDQEVVKDWLTVDREIWELLDETEQGGRQPPRTSEDLSKTTPLTG